MTTDLIERYGRPAPWRRRAAAAIAVCLGVVSLAWLIWAAWFHSTPLAKSTLVTYQVDGPSTVQVRLQVELGDETRATCRLRAMAEDHTTVGELAFTPTDGVNDVIIRTEREATSVEKIGCTAPGQNRPQ